MTSSTPPRQARQHVTERCLVPEASISKIDSYDDPLRLRHHRVDSGPNAKLSLRLDSYLGISAVRRTVEGASTFSIALIDSRCDPISQPHLPDGTAVDRLHRHMQPRSRRYAATRLISARPPPFSCRHRSRQSSLETLAPPAPWHHISSQVSARHVYGILHILHLATSSFTTSSHQQSTPTPCRLLQT